MPATKPSTASLEALLYAHGAPMSLTAIVEALGVERDTAHGLLGELRHELKGRGIALVEGEDGYELTVTPAQRSFVAAALAHTAQPLSQSAIEVLTVIAYKQPVTKAAVDELRGVASDASLKSLLARDLIVVAGQADGAPTYRTTNHFLKSLGLTKLDELPPQKGLA